MPCIFNMRATVASAERLRREKKHNSSEIVLNKFLKCFTKLDEDHQYKMNGREWERGEIGGER